MLDPPILMIYHKLRASRAWGADFSKSGYDTKPKQAIKAREIDPEHETEMNGSSVEDYRTIDLDIKCYADHDKATSEARY